MERANRLSRKRASLKIAKKAAGPEARLAHYDLAGRYSLNAMSAETLADDVVRAPPGPIYADIAGEPVDEMLDA